MNISVLNDMESLTYYNTKPAKLIPNAQLQLQTIQYNTHTYINYPRPAKIFPTMLSFTAQCRYYNSKWRV